MRTLIVDDDEDIREVMELILESRGHEVSTARDGRAALRSLLSGSRPDVILLDMMMPRMDGEAFLGAMRAHPELVDIPVIIISGMQDAQRTAHQLGVAGCLVKPVDLDDLVAAVQRVGVEPAAVH